MVEDTLDQAKSLLNAERFKEAATALNTLIGKNKDNDELWYLRGLVSLKLKNYDNAHEYFEHALWINQKPAYYKIKGMAHMEMYEFEQALEQLEKAAELDKKDVSTFFYIAICYMFLNNQLGKEYLQRAYVLDKKKTKSLIKNFYSIFFKEEKLLNSKIKRALESKIESIPT